MGYSVNSRSKKYLQLMQIIMILVTMGLTLICFGQQQAYGASKKDVSSLTMKLSSTSLTYNGKIRKPSVEIYDSKGNAIDPADYQVSYQDGRALVGSYSVTADVNNKEYAGTLTASFTIKPKKTQIASLSSKNNCLTMEWKKNGTQCDGYQVQYSESSAFSSSKSKKIKLSGNRNLETEVKKLPIKDYYVRVRCYKKADGKYYYSKWSDVESIKIKQKSQSLNCECAVIMDVSGGKLWYSKNGTKTHAEGSTTKLMTALLAIEENSSQDKVKITDAAASTPYSKLGDSVVGDSIRMKDLLYMCLLPSDNGVATTLAIHTSGSVNGFVQEMNRKAKALGMSKSQFKNAHGLDSDGHYTTAKDLAILARNCYKNKTFRGIVGTKNYSFASLNRNIRYNVSTTNQLLGNVSGVVGGKTGTTTRAGKCFVCFYEKSDRVYVTVVLGCDSDDDRWADTRKLITYIKNYAY